MKAKTHINWSQSLQFFLWIIVCGASMGASVGVGILIYRALVWSVK